MHTAITVDTAARLDTVSITNEVAATFPDELEAGICSVYVPHTTAAIVVNEDESRLREDTEEFLTSLVPSTGHRHDEIDGNADSHLRATMLGPSATVPVREGGLALGTWGDILVIDCDGPRSRTVEVTVVPTGE